MAEKTVMEEMDEALGPVVDEPTPDAETQGAEGETEGLDTETEGTEGETEGAEGETEDTEGETEERGPNGERERNPDGTWKAKEQLKLDADGKPIKEVKKADPLNDPIPKELKKETQERIRTLIDTTKTVTAERDAIRKDFDYLVTGVQATGATPAQYGETLNWLALFNSRDPAQQEKALELVESVADRLATLLGKERSVGDPLAAHADLRDAVTKGQITAQYAKEIARTRNGQQFRSQLTSSATQEQQQQQAREQELTQARSDLTALGNTLKASDPDYEAKKAILVPALKPVFAVIPPSQWAAKFQEAYKAVKVSAPAKPRSVPANQPLRAKQPAGGATKAPSSMLEAISGALSGMRK